MPRTARRMTSHALRVVTGRPSGAQASLLPGVIERLAERGSNISVVAALRKISDRDFSMPIQGMYSGQNLEAEELRKKYGSA